MKLKIAIVGAGISGLTAGILLKKLGHDVSIFEKSSSISEYGAGINLSRNATILLERSGLLDGLKDISQYPSRSIIRNYKGSKEIASKDLKGLITCDRRELVKFLSNSFIDQEGDLHLSNEVHEVNASTGELSFKNKEKEKADLVLACDGIKSLAKVNNFKEIEARFSGYVAWRGIVDIENLSNSKKLKDINIYYGPGAHVVHYPIGQKGKINFIAIQSSPDWLGESWRTLGKKEDLLEEFKDWDKDILRLFSNCSKVYKWGIFDRKQLHRLVDSKLVLMGDAAHPMVPFMGQGACMSIEDAYIFSRLLEDHPENLNKALGGYQKLRLKRVSWMQKRSRIQGKFNHISNPLIAKIRNLATRSLISRNIEDIHSYDADLEMSKL